MKLIDFSKATEKFACNGCGAMIYFFDASNQLAHAPPDCEWFKEQLQKIPPDSSESAIAVLE